MAQNLNHYTAHHINVEIQNYEMASLQLFCVFQTEAIKQNDVF